jgi:uncharacterized protein (TIGR02145 family)
MILIKALLTGLVGVSLCMADISGIVTDTGTTPIAGAVVWLEKGRQTATTGADGRFTIVVSAAILHGNSKLLPIGLSARIYGAMLIVTIAEQAVVEVATFDLNGKALSNIRQTMETGVHTIALPQRIAGVYLYKVKSGNRKLLLKSNSVGGVSSRSAVLPGTASNLTAKQAKSAVTINDVIAATKAGYLNYRCVQYNSDTSGIVIKMIACAGTLTDTDGDVYQTVRIGNQVWMAENLRVTKYNDGSLISLDSSTVTWNNATTPKYCFYENITISDSIKKYGALYNWYVVNPVNPKNIAPTGWHVPSDAEWDTLQNYLTVKGYNWDGTITGNKIAKSLAAMTDWAIYSTTGTIGCDLTINNSSGFAAIPGGCRIFNGTFVGKSLNGYLWSATEFDASTPIHRDLRYDGDYLTRGNYLTKSCGFSVRLVRD